MASKRLLATEASKASRASRKGRNTNPVKQPKRTMAEISAQAATKKDAKETIKLSRHAAAMERRLREEEGAEAIANAEEDIEAETAHDDAYLRDSLEAAFSSDSGESESQTEVVVDGNDMTGTAAPRQVRTQTACKHVLLTDFSNTPETKQGAEKAHSNGGGSRSY
jgi:hypothetical protein